MMTMAKQHEGNIRLKLFVLGERSGNPDDWHEWVYDRMIVVAENADAAKAFEPDYDDVFEIDLSISRLIAHEYRPTKVG